jgi:magnesium transporter
MADSTGELTFESAALLMTRNVPVLHVAATVADVRAAIRTRRFDFLGDLAVCDGATLVGLLKIEDALAAADSVLVRTLMDPDPPTVTHAVDQEVVAWKAVRHGEGALAVVDDDNRFLGLIPPQRLLGVMLQEHDEDLARLGGFIRGSSSAREASTETTALRLWHRLPWLFIGLLGAIAAAFVVEGFEERLREEVLLAFFIPGVVYLADAVGTQTEALVIRGMSVGVSMREMMRRELITGVVAGTVLGVTFFPIGIVLWGDADVVLAVSLSLFAACSVATVVASGLPWLFSAAGQDPAFGSGPLSTVIQDLLSIVLYLSIASMLV